MAKDKDALDSEITVTTSETNAIATKAAMIASLSNNANTPTTINNAHTIASGKLDSFSPASFFVQSSTIATVQGSGISLGNSGGWTVGALRHDELHSGVRGINQLYGFVHNKHAVGDCAGIYGYVYTDGGISAQSDEGVTGCQTELNENEGYFHGTVTSTTGKGDQKPVWAFASGNNWTTDGAFMLNISKGTIKGNVIAPSQSLPNTFLNFMPVTKDCLPLTTAWGILKVPITNQGVTADSPISCTFTVTLQPINGILEPFIEDHYVVVAGINYPEQAKLLLVVDHGDGTQTLTMLLHNPNIEAVIFQDGIAGQFISFGANQRFSGMRSSYYAFGSLTGSDLIYGVNIGGGVVNNYLPQIGSEAVMNDGGSSSDFELFPGAEIVSNPDFYSAKGTLEQNNVLWEQGDIVENPHYPVHGGTAAWFTRKQITPGPSVGLKIDLVGPGIGGGGSVIADFGNYNPPQYYKGNGGPLSAPAGLVVRGPTTKNIYIGSAHEPGGAMIEVQNPNNLNNPDAPVLVVNLDWLGGGNLWFVNGGWKFDGPLNVDGGLSINSAPGVDGTYQSLDGKTVTVSKGLTISIK